MDKVDDGLGGAIVTLRGQLCGKAADEVGAISPGLLDPERSRSGQRHPWSHHQVHLTPGLVIGHIDKLRRCGLETETAVSAGQFLGVSEDGPDVVLHSVVHPLLGPDHQVETLTALLDNTV